MFLNFFKSGIFDIDYRRQLLASICGLQINKLKKNKTFYYFYILIYILATTMSFLHGVGLGWLSPMLPKLQSKDETPFEFVIDVHEASWIGATICIGGVLGNLLFLAILDRFGRKIAMYGLAFPHMVSSYQLNYTTIFHNQNSQYNLFF